MAKEEVELLKELIQEVKKVNKNLSDVICELKDNGCKLDFINDSVR